MYCSVVFSCQNSFFSRPTHHMMMHNCYWFGTYISDLLFKGFTIPSTRAFVMVCLGFSALGLVNEGIKIYQHHLKLKSKANNQHCHSTRCSSETDSLLSDVPREAQSSKWLIPLKITAVYTLQMIVSYMLMLIVMTYNGYFTIASALGALIGYLIFGSELYQREDNVLLRRKCRSCLESIRNNENVPEDNEVLPNTAEGGDAPYSDPVEESQPEQSEAGNCCHESVVQVHNVDV